jgi:hypothetical protein
MSKHHLSVTYNYLDYSESVPLLCAFKDIAPRIPFKFYEKDATFLSKIHISVESTGEHYVTLHKRTTNVNTEEYDKYISDFDKSETLDALCDGRIRNLLVDLATGNVVYDLDERNTVGNKFILFPPRKIKTCLAIDKDENPAHIITESGLYSLAEILVIMNKLISTKPTKEGIEFTIHLIETLYGLDKISDWLIRDTVPNPQGSSIYSELVSELEKIIVKGHDKNKESILPRKRAYAPEDPMLSDLSFLTLKEEQDLRDRSNIRPFFITLDYPIDHLISIEVNSGMFIWKFNTKKGEINEFDFEGCPMDDVKYNE